MSYSLTTFSQNGKLLGIVNARQAVANGNTSLGIKAKNGVVLACEKKLENTLVDAKTVQKINTLTKNIGIAYSGMGPDFRILTRRGRKDAQRYYLRYHEDVPVGVLASEVASTMQEFTQSGGVRPFGVSLFLAGYDHNGPQLYEIDPSGSYWAWKASAIGKNATSAKTFLQKRYDPEMELEDAIHTAILTLKEGFEGAVTEHNIEIATVDENGVFKTLSPSELKDYINEVE
jgi:20S proteasome subunit alpha 2